MNNELDPTSVAIFFGVVALVVIISHAVLLWEAKDYWVGKELIRPFFKSAAMWLISIVAILSFHADASIENLGDLAYLKIVVFIVLMSTMHSLGHVAERVRKMLRYE